MSGPLAGIRVVDLTTVVMGPYATQILGDMGADVIKVESPEGDVFRYVQPFRNPGMSAAFMNLNRNKRSIALDLKKPEERAILHDLVERSDVFVSTVRPQALRKLGLDYESLSKLNPRLIYCGAYGFSERGPYAGRGAFDDIIQCMSGLAAIQGHHDGVPKYVNTIMADKTTGYACAWAIAMALFERERSGRGQSVEVPMFETMVSFNLTEHLGGETFPPAETAMGYDRVLSIYRKPYRTRDGYIGLLPYTNDQWARFFELAGRPEMRNDPRVTDPTVRGQNIGQLYKLLDELVAQKTTDEWLKLLSTADIPHAPILSMNDLITDEHLEAVEFFQRQQHPSEGEIRTMAIPVTFGRTPGTLRRPAPRLNEHREEILRELREAT